MRRMMTKQNEKNLDSYKEQPSTRLRSTTVLELPQFSDAAITTVATTEIII